MRQRAQLGQLRRQCTTHHGPDARHAAQQILVLAPERRRLDPVSQVLVHRRGLPLQPSQMGLYLPQDWTRRRPHAEQRSELLRRLIRQGT